MQAWWFEASSSHPSQDRAQTFHCGEEWASLLSFHPRVWVSFLSFGASARSLRGWVRRESEGKSPNRAEMYVHYIERDSGALFCIFMLRYDRPGIFVLSNRNFNLALNSGSGSRIPDFFGLFFAWKFISELTFVLHWPNAEKRTSVHYCRRFQSCSNVIHFWHFLSLSRKLRNLPIFAKLCHSSGF